MKSPSRSRSGLAGILVGLAMLTGLALIVDAAGREFGDL